MWEATDDNKLKLKYTPGALIGYGSDITDGGAYSADSADYPVKEPLTMTLPTHGQVRRLPSPIGSKLV